MIGFGIKTKADVSKVHQMADGAIIGSAYINALSKGAGNEFISAVWALEPKSL
jgi:tryptophan synthase alpha subunit